jgi:preprotein translocase subunit SecF
MQFLIKPNFDFMKYRKVWALVSIALTVLAIVVVFVRGKLNVGIDFAGGTQVIVRFHDAPEVDALRQALAQAGIQDASLQRFGGETQNEFIIRTPLQEGLEQGRETEILAALDRTFNQAAAGKFDLNQRDSEALAGLLMEADPMQLAAADAGTARLHYQDVADAILAKRRADGVLTDWQALSAIPEVTPEVLQALQQRAHFGSFALLSQEVVGPTMGAELRKRGIWAVVLSMLAMLVYIWIRFELRFGIGAVIAILHDVIVMLGLYALVGFEFNLTTVAAFLTLVGYSVNDSVVVFDRVRENMHKAKRQSFEKTLNDAINETLSRTLLTGMTTIAAMGALLFFGGEVLRGFAFVMVVGVLVGTYSSIWVASAFTLLWQNMMDRREAAAPAAAANADKGGKLAPAKGDRR